MPREIPKWIVTGTLIGVGPGEDSDEVNKFTLTEWPPSAATTEINFGWGAAARVAA